MSEVTDVVLPILQRIQADVADVKREVNGLTERMDKIESYVTYSLGVISQKE